MCKFIELLNDNNGVIMAILTFIMVAINFLQWKLTNKIQREVNRPKVMANVVGKKGEMCYILVNYGTTSAVNIKIRIDPNVIAGFQKQDPLRSKLEHIEKGNISLLPNGQTLIPTHTMWNKLKDTTISFSYTYEDLSGKKYAEKYEFDMSILNAIITERPSNEREKNI